MREREPEQRGPDLAQILRGASPADGLATKERCRFALASKLQLRRHRDAIGVGGEEIAYVLLVVVIAALAGLVPALKAYKTPGLRRIGIDPTGRKFAEYYPQDVALVPDFFSAAAFRS